MKIGRPSFVMPVNSYRDGGRSPRPPPLIDGAHPLPVVRVNDNRHPFPDDLFGGCVAEHLHKPSVDILMPAILRDDGDPVIGVFNGCSVSLFALRQGLRGLLASGDIPHRPFEVEHVSLTVQHGSRIDGDPVEATVFSTHSGLKVLNRPLRLEEVNHLQCAAEGLPRVAFRCRSPTGSTRPGSRSRGFGQRKG